MALNSLSASRPGVDLPGPFDPGAHVVSTFVVTAMGSDSLAVVEMIEGHPHVTVAARR